MNVFLARLSGWDSSIVIGVFSTKELALSNSVTYLLEESISMNENDILTPINEEINSNGNSMYDITNSDDVLSIMSMEIDKRF